MAMLERLIKSIFEDAKSQNSVRRQHAYIVDLCKRGEAAQDYIHLKLKNRFIPTYVQTKTELADTTEKLRAERRRLIEVHCSKTI